MVESNRPDLDVKFSMDEKAISLGQAYSQLGQVYANFEREDAEVYFLRFWIYSKRKMRIADCKENQKLCDAIRTTLQQDVKNIERTMT